MWDNVLNHFTICIAGIVVRINTLYSKSIIPCLDYLSEQTPDFEITITKQDLIDEQAIALQNDNDQTKKHLELLAVYRKILDRAIAYNAIMIHGAAIAVNDAAHVFCGKSGVGKTTHIKKWLEQNSNAYVINGDKPIIRLVDGTFYVCGTPWSGKEHMNTNTMVPLKSILFMTRSEDNSIVRMDFSQAFPLILNQIHRNKDIGKMHHTLDLVERMKDTVQFYSFSSNNIKADSYRVAYDAIVGK